MSFAVKVAPRTFGSPGSSPLCGHCEKAVYAAERVAGPSGRSYHRACLKCVSCGKTLQPAQLLDHDGEPYCKQCHTSQFGIEGYGYGGTSVAKSYTDKWSPRSSPAASPTKPSSALGSPAPSGSGSPLKAKFPADDEDEWAPKPPAPPKPDFVSRRPFAPAAQPLTERPPSSASNRSDTALAPPATRSLSNRTPSPVSPPRSPAATPDLGRLNLNDGPDACARCHKTVYHAEKMLAAGRTWHKRCLRCVNCSKALDSHLVVSGSDPFCKKCHGERSGLAAGGIMTRPGLY